MVVIRHLIMTLGMLVLLNGIWIGMILIILTHIHTIIHITTGILIIISLFLFRSTIRTTSIIMIIPTMVIIGSLHMIVIVIADGGVNSR